jgi:hypothetical protein
VGGDGRNREVGGDEQALSRAHAQVDQVLGEGAPGRGAEEPAESRRAETRRPGDLGQADVIREALVEQP